MFHMAQNASVILPLPHLWVFIPYVLLKQFVDYCITASNSYGPCATIAGFRLILTGCWSRHIMNCWQSEQTGLEHMNPSVLAEPNQNPCSPSSLVFKSSFKSQLVVEKFSRWEDRSSLVALPWIHTANTSFWILILKGCISGQNIAIMLLIWTIW
jgi:hypothetical protein